jgi:hypothetical protein
MQNPDETYFVQEERLQLDLLLPGGAKYFGRVA